MVNPLRRLVQSPGRTVSAMGVAPADRVLEIGAGPGFFSTHLAARVPSGHLVVLDLQPEMLVLARDRLGARPVASGVGADAMELPFGAGRFDAALLATVLGEIPDVDRALAELRRVLRDGGTLAVSETRRDSDFIPLAQLRPLVEGHGFELVERRGVGWQYVARFRAC